LQPKVGLYRSAQKSFVHIGRRLLCLRCFCRKTETAPDRVGSEARELTSEDLVRIAQKILGILEEEQCTVAQADEILQFTREAAPLWAPVKCGL